MLSRRVSDEAGCCAGGRNTEVAQNTQFPTSEFCAWLILLFCSRKFTHFINTLRLLYILSCMLSRFSEVQLFVTPWTVARQAPLSMGFSRQEYWSGLPFPSPGDLPNPGIELVSLSTLVGDFSSTNTTWEAHILPSYVENTGNTSYFVKRKTNIESKDKLCFTQ